MTDYDQTILSSKGSSNIPGAPPPEPPKKSNPLLIIGGIGCVLVLCFVVMLGIGLFLAKDQLSQLTTGLTSDEFLLTPELPALEPTAAAAATSVSATVTAAAAAATSALAAVTVAAPPTVEINPTATVAPPAEPKINKITFALGVTKDNQPVNPGIEFKDDVTEIHALFDYSGFTPKTTWERVWYLDGKEMLRNSEAWSGDKEGVFDYFVNAGDAPLAPGVWKLELYADGQLLASDSFTIAGKTETVVAEVSPTATVTATSVATTVIAAATVESATEVTATTAITATPKPASTPRPAAKTYKLAYTKWDGGKHNLYIGDTNGGPETFMLNRAAGPSWTPDGKTLFFYGEEGIDRQELPDGRHFNFDGVSNGIVAMTVSPMPTAIEQVRLFQGNDWKNGSARWANVSPDGQMVAFDAKPSGSYRIYFLGTADNQQYRFELLGEQGDWSPDGKKVVYRSGRDGKTGIWISNRDDSGHTQITEGGSDSFPAWSPDGKTIVFHRDEGGNVDLYAVNVDGSNLRRLTDAAGPDTLPVFTPSGQIIFRSARSGSWSIWKMNADGSGQKEIIPNAGVGPDWSFSRMGVLR